MLPLAKSLVTASHCCWNIGSSIRMVSVFFLTWTSWFIIRDQSRYAPSQWEMSLQCNNVSDWLGAYLDWSLHHQWAILWAKYYFRFLDQCQIQWSAMPLYFDQFSPLFSQLAPHSSSVRVIFVVYCEFKTLIKVLPRPMQCHIVSCYIGLRYNLITTSDFIRWKLSA